MLGEIHLCLRQTIIAQLIRYEGDGDFTTLTWFKRLGLDNSVEIWWQMHQSWLHAVSTIVQDMDLLHRGVALVHIIKLQHILIEQQGTHRQRIAARIVLYLCQYHTTHGEINRLCRTFGDDSGRLLEMTQLTSVVSHLDGKLIT